MRRCALLSALLVLIAALRVVSTYTVLSHTVDEPIHLGAGMEWLDHGTITGDASHPPLARVLSAIGPWLAGERWIPPGNTLLDGVAILGRDAHYDRMLALARLGILPLFLLACTIVFLWGNRTGGPLAGLIATFLFTTTAAGAGARGTGDHRHGGNGVHRGGSLRWRCCGPNGRTGGARSCWASRWGWG